MEVEVEEEKGLACGLVRVCTHIPTRIEQERKYTRRAEGKKRKTLHKNIGTEEKTEKKAISTYKATNI